MNDAENLVHPAALAGILEETARLGFTMASEPLTGSLLRTLVQSKVGGAVLELGPTAWVRRGCSTGSTRARDSSRSNRTRR